MEPFTRLDPETSPVGRKFHALEHDMGGLSPFIGVRQVTAAVLLLVPATALAGALMYLPIVSGIVVITTTIDFRATGIITSPMLLGAVYLICWDWHRIRFLLDPDVAVPRTRRPPPAGEEP